MVGITTIKSDNEGFGIKFNDFYQYGEQNVYKIQNKDVFFKSDKIYNPLKELATVLITDCDAIEMPVLSYVSGWANDALGDFSKSSNVNIKLHSLYAKFRIAINLFYKINSFVDYVQNSLLMQLANLERNFFLNGPEEDDKKGLLGFFQDDMVKILPQKPSNGILELMQKLSSNYQSNATFIMSNNILKILNNQSQENPQLLFNGITKLFGKDIVLMDEIGDKILFGDFKQAVVIAENKCDTIYCNSGSVPNYVEIGLPNSIGITVVNQKALVCAELSMDADDVLYSKRTSPRGSSDELEGVESTVAGTDNSDQDLQRRVHIPGDMGKA